jgi:hypothetical protein
MSLKGFHILFIVLSIALALLFGVWALRLYSQIGGARYLGMGLGALALGAALVVYGIWFLKKTRGMES